MKITRDDVLRVAELANLELTEAEIETFGQQLGSILTYCEKLNQLDTANVEPMAQVLTAAAATDQGADLRDDAARDAGVIGEVIRRAPQGMDAEVPYFRVPKVVERGT
jgi:aspartyl-tRNA(Asn)/glutamyl-tRNA(Gln) amidotransferase subunit C